MNRISLFFILFLAVALSTTAQPARRRAEQQAAASRNAGALTVRAQISFPTSAPMPEDVVWRRDIYRQIDLTQDANAGLYYPVEPVGNQMNLFTYIFKLFMLRQIPVYEYRLSSTTIIYTTRRLTVARVSTTVISRRRKSLLITSRSVPTTIRPHQPSTPRCSRSVPL